jgi:hypothetical protein
LVPIRGGEYRVWLFHPFLKIPGGPFTDEF